MAGLEVWRSKDEEIAGNSGLGDALSLRRDE
jgi:hypothetical protein